MLRALSRLLRRTGPGQLELGLEAVPTTGAELLAQSYGDEENLEGVTAFLERRKPDYRKFRRPEPATSQS